MRPRRLTDIQFDLLDLFERVARQGSIAAAARDLGFSASTATRKLIALEDALGARLFNRSTRKLSLTEAGVLALNWAQASLISLDEAAEDLAAVTGEPSGKIRLAAPHFGMSTYLPPVLSEFARAYPGISLDITATDELVNLIDDKIDVAIRYGTLPDTRNVAVRLAEFDRIVCASPRYIEAHGKPEQLSDLARHFCIQHRQTDSSTWAFRKDGQLVYQPISARFQINNTFSIELLALAGGGIARLPTITFEKSIAEGKLVRLLPEYECVEESGDKPSIWIVHAGRDLPYRVRLLVDHLKASVPGARLKLYEAKTTATVA